MKYAIIVGIIAVLLTFFDDRKIIKKGFQIAMIILTVFCAIRWEWGVDMPGYAKTFDEYGALGVKFWQIDQLNVRANRISEYGWSILNVLCQPIGFFGMTILLSVLEGGIVYWFVEKYVPRGYRSISVFLYAFNSNLMVLGCSMMRQWLAMCIILVAAHFVIKGKFLPYIFTIIFASLFHASAIFMLPFYFLRSMSTIKINSYVILFIVALILLWVYLLGRFMSGAIDFIMEQGINEMYGSYANSKNTVTVGFGSFMNIIVALVCLINITNGSNQAMKMIAWVYIGYIIVLPLGTVMPIMSRFTFYFELLGISVIPYGVKSIRQPLLKTGLLVWIVLWYCMLFNNFFHASTWRDSYMTYNTIFNAPFWQ